MTDTFARFRPRGPRVRAPALDLVPVASDEAEGIAIAYDRSLWASPALDQDLAPWLDRLRAVDVPGVAPLIAHSPGIFVYGAPPLRSLRALLGSPAGVRAGLELVLSAGEVLAARPLGPHAGLSPELLGLDAEGMAWILGWRLPPVDVLRFVGDPAATPDEAARHAPPERFEGIEEDETADLYVLVATAAMWMTGRPLFEDAAAERARGGEAEHAVKSLGLPDDVAELFSIGLAADPAERPDANAFLDEVERLIATAEGESADRAGRLAPDDGSDPTAWWDALFSRDFADDETAPRDGDDAVRRARVLAGVAEAARIAAEVRTVGNPEEIARSDAAAADARAAAEADPHDGADRVAAIVGDLSVLRAGIEVRRVDEARIAAERAAAEAENQARLVAARAAAEALLAGAQAEAADCADDPAVAQILGEIQAGVARAVEGSLDGSATRAERAVDAMRRVKARLAPVISAARARAAEIRAQAARRAADEAEARLGRIAAAARSADALAERLERQADQVGRPLDKLAPELGEARTQAPVAQALAEAAAAHERVSGSVALARRLAIEVEFCADPTEAEARLSRLGSVADDVRAALAALEAAVARARDSAGEERDRLRRARLAEVREVASARAAAVDPVSADVEAARIDLAASLEGDPVPPDIRGALATWDQARGHVQAQRDALAEAAELADAEVPAARLSAATDAAVVAGSALIAVIRRTVLDRERDRDARRRAAVEKQVKAARTEARRSVAAADGSAAAGDREAAAAELERMAGLRRRVRQGQRDLEAAEGAGADLGEIAASLLEAAGELVAAAAEVDAATAAARSARDPSRGERMRRLRRGADPAREALAASLKSERPRSDERAERVRAIRRLAGADATEVIQRRASRPPASEPADGDATTVFVPGQDDPAEE